MAVPYTKQALIERIKRHIANGFPQGDFSISDNEVLLAIDANIPTVLKAGMFENAKVTGVLEVPDAWLVTYDFTISNQDANTKEWYLTLPQPPLALPTGYDITNVYVADAENGRGGNAFPIKNKRQAFRSMLPKPSGFSYRIGGGGQKMFLSASNGQSLLDVQVMVEMPISRTEGVSAPLYMPDDAIEALFKLVVVSMLQRLGVPQDVIQDNLPQGNKTP